MGHELLVPGHRVALDGGHGEELDTFGQVHHQAVGVGILGVQHKGNLHRAIAEALTDGGLHGVDVVKCTCRELGGRIGGNDANVVALALLPLHGGIRAPGVILCFGLYDSAESCQQRDQSVELFHDGLSLDKV